MAFSIPLSFGKSWRRGLAATAALAIIFAGYGRTSEPGPGGISQAHAAPAEPEPRSPGGPTTLRRLSEDQYKNSIAAIFSPEITVPGRFDPPLRDHGLLAIGDGQAIISASGTEQNELRAREIAAQVLAPERRAAMLSCAPKSEALPDQDCAAAFLTHYGRLLFRRPLSDMEVAWVTGLAAAATRQMGNFYSGLQFGLAGLLNSPNFLFKVERSVADPSMPGGFRLDDYSLASRISFLLWNAPPDSELLAAVERKALRSPAGLEQQVDRMAAAPAFEHGLRAFFTDMFAFNQFDGLSKDQTLYPKYTSAVAGAAKEQLLRTIVDHLVGREGDYRDLFTTRRTFMNRTLGSLYSVPVPLPEGAELGTWVPYTFDEADRRAGILTLVGFLMLDPTHEGRSSPTNRGKAVRELFLCQPVPLPPANVDFSAVQNTADQVHKTSRERLTLHQENPACAGCHALTDPIGLAMENYDAVGEFRTRENGALIDASGTFEGRDYADAIGLQQALRDSPATPLCAARRVFEYGAGRPLEQAEEPWIEYAAERFADDAFRFPALMRRIATSSAFRAVAGQPALARPQTAAIAPRPADRRMP